MSFSCPRCGEPLHPIDAAVPPFCAHCGLPQLRLSPEAAAPQSSTETPEAKVSTAVNWSRALRMTALGAVAGVGLPSMLPGAVVNGVVPGLSLLLMPLLALGVIFAYTRSRPSHALAPAEGGSLGALLGLLMGCLLALITGATGFGLRYLRHSHAMDDRIGQAAAQLPAQISAAGPLPPEVLGMIQSPEFRAGTFILSLLFSLLLLVAVGSLCGWASAMMLRHRRERTVSND